MKIACLQFDPQVGRVSENVARAEQVLAEVENQDIDFLILPELAFSGYNFPSLEAITPFLEPSQAGVSTEWAKRTAARLRCVVTVGYPELCTVHDPETNTTTTCNYNAAITVSPSGEVLSHYRKTFLYYTDDTWSKEGPDGFTFFDYKAPFNARVAHGICMDVNPYKFEAPWAAYEFATHLVASKVDIAAMSMAWMAAPPGADDGSETSGSNAHDTENLEKSKPEQEAVSNGETISELPAYDTLKYWVARFQPLLSASSEKPRIVAICNRSGSEGNAKYAGTSTVMSFQDGQVRLWGFLGQSVQRCLLVDTSQPPPFICRLRA